jgi:putative selenate reductase
MAELVPAPFGDLIQRIRLELAQEGAIFHLPRRKWWAPDPNGPDLSVGFHGQKAGTPVGPAAGPQSQMAQNMVMSWLAGSRIMELKTVQINDRLLIGRPCIDATNVGYNIEWSQELRISQALREYVAGAMLIHMLAHGGLLGDEPIVRGATETIYDISLGYDLGGIRSAPVRAFVEQMRDASAMMDRLRSEIPRELPALRNLDFPTRLSTSVTLSTFHGCPADEIERICEFLLTEMDLDVVIKMNPPMLGKERLEHLLHDVLGYAEIRVPDHAYDSGLQFDESLALCARLTALAASRGRRLGAKFSNTLEVENHRAFFSSDYKTQYLSGQPLHVITLTLANEFRKAVGPEMPLTFSAGIDRFNFADTVACGFCPVTTCTDLLRPGGYGRLPAYLTTLAEAMGKLGAGDIDEYVLRARRQDNRNASTTPAICHAAAHNLAIITREVQAEPRYRARANRKIPKRIDSHLHTFDCITCDKCIPVCPNAANFLYATEKEELTFTDYVVQGKSLSAGAERRIAVERTEQIANFADFCNDCGNCDTFCPEYDGPFIRKPNFFGSFQAWASFPRRDGFFIDTSLPHRRIHGRIRGKNYLLDADATWNGLRFEDGVVCLFLRSDHTIENWFAFGPSDATGHIVDMTAYHTLRILLSSLLRLDHIHQANVGLAARAAAAKRQAGR